MSKLKYIAGAALFAATIGIISSADASAANFENPTITLNRSITNLQATSSNTFSYQLTADSNNPSDVDISLLSDISCEVSGTPTGGTLASTDCSINFSGVDFNGAAYGRYKFTVRETGSVDSTRYPVDSSDTYTVYINYYAHHSNANGDPILPAVPYLEITSVRQNDTTKVDAMSFTSAANLEPSAIQITNAVNGTFANTEDEFSYTVKVGGRASSSSNYSIYKKGVSASTTSSCTYDSAADESTCTFTLKHNEQAFIGWDGNNEREINPGYTFTVEQTKLSGYNTVEINGTEDADAKTDPAVVLEPVDHALQNVVNFVNKSGIEPADSKAFFNILPFVILGGAAIIAIAATRKNKQNR